MSNDDLFEKKNEFFFNKLKKNKDHIGKKARRMGITCYRIYGKDIPEFPFIIDVYEKYLHISLHSSSKKQIESSQTWIDSCIDVISRALSIAKENIFLKRRYIQDREKQYERLSESAFLLDVFEGGYKLTVDLNSYFDTGLFLDHRKSRELIGQMSLGKDVLNLFSYTCSFSVYAIGGGAKSVKSVDMNKNYLEWGKRNVTNNFPLSNQFTFVNADTISFLKEERNKYDLIILDPPSFSRSKKMKGVLSIQDDHFELINDCLSLLRRDGCLFFSTNLKGFKMYKEKIKSEFIKEITATTLDFDFQKKRPHFSFLIKN